MPSSWSPSLRFELQFTGENINLWGEKLNTALTRVDTAIAGWLVKPLTGSTSLSAVNDGPDEARAAMIRFTGALTEPATVSIPAVSKAYLIWNAADRVVTLTTARCATAVSTVITRSRDAIIAAVSRKSRAPVFAGAKLIALCSDSRRAA